MKTVSFNSCEDIVVESLEDLPNGLYLVECVGFISVMRVHDGINHTNLLSGDYIFHQISNKIKVLGKLEESDLRKLVVNNDKES